MITPEIISYIKVERAKGTPDALIHTNLLDNGWHEQDITEAISALATNPSLDATSIPKNKINTVELKKHRNKRIGITFIILLLVDFIIIMYMGGRGVFGISPLSIVLRIVVIYGIASFAAIGSKEKATTVRTIIDSIARVVAAVAITLLIMVGLLFLTCLVALNGHSGF